MTISAKLRQLVKDRADNCCEYCRIAPDERILPFHIDHIISIKHGGTDNEDNLCFSCYKCNIFKGSNVAAIDPETDQPTRLYNPRKQDWDDHFDIIEDGIIEAKTPEGRATLLVLRMNDSHRIQQRESLIKQKRYPCKK